MKAWLISTIEKNSKEKIISILNSKLRYDKVLNILNIIHINIVINNFEDILYFAKNPKEYPYSAKCARVAGVFCHYRLYCGHNPRSYAVLVDNISVIDVDGERVLKFREPIIGDKVNKNRGYVSRPLKYKKEYTYIKI
jgi:hypothetical protein